MSVIGYCARGLRRQPHLSALLEAPSRFFVGRPPQAVTHIAGWGLKPSTITARRIAAKNGLPYISLEDGFLRSLGLGVLGAPLHSLAVDHSGIYYDATRPSDLESLIRDEIFSDAELARARQCIALLRKYRLSKYNHVADFPLDFADNRPRVLVVDQTYGDASVAYGLADAQRFLQMLECAIEAHPDAQVCVKVHPDVIAGKKRGYLLDAARKLGCRVLADDISPWALLDAVEDVYVVTSQLGFDALMAGKRVHCFGMPFYAGWGLTEDQLGCERRNIAKSLEQVFSAAYLRYCRYINPYSGERCGLEDTIHLIADQKSQRDRLAGNWLAVGFSPWKRGFVPAFLGKPESLRMIAADSAQLQKVVSGTRVAVWASSVPAELGDVCASRQLDLWRLEDGFLRSVGLGADLIAPLSLVLDSRGIYYDAGKASDLEVTLKQSVFDRDLLQRAGALRLSLIVRQLSKYNVGSGQTLPLLELPAGKRIILVPGQVETDASIAHGSPEIKTNLDLLAAVRRSAPDAYIIYKPHPDVVSGGRLGELDAVSAEDAFDLQLTDCSILALLDLVDEVHTLCSLSGFEALLRGKKVVTYGLPFYAGWGLTEDWLLGAETQAGLSDSSRAVVRRCQQARGRKLNLDELVAGALILYPTYIDPETGEHINAETAVQLLAADRDEQRAVNWWTKIYRVYRNRFLRR